MKKISSFLALLLFAFTAFQVLAKESFVDKTPEWWRQATPQMVEDMIKNGADINEKSELDESALMHAALITQNPDIIETLIKSGADIEAKDNAGYTALMKAAAYNSNSQVIESLIKSGTNLEVKNKYGLTALMNAALINQNPDIIETLIKYGADIEATEKHGLTALMVAVIKNKNPDIINILIKHDANVNVKDNTGNTALDYAKENPYIYGTDAYKLLEEKTDNKKIKIVDYKALNCTIEHNKQICEEADLNPFTGIAMFYHLGNLLSKTSYKNGLVDGKVKAYDAYDAYMYLEADNKQGELLSATCYDKNGKIIQCKCDRFNWRIKQIMKQCR